MTGSAKIFFIDGDIYEGDWIKGKMTGKGRKFYAQNGDVYDGEYKNDKCPNYAYQFGIWELSF